MPGRGEHAAGVAHRDPDPLRRRGRAPSARHAELSRRARREVEGGVDALGVLAAGDGEVGRLAAAALDGLGGVGDELAGVEAAVLGDRRDQGGAATVGRAAEHDGADAGPVAHGDGEVADAVAVEPVDAGDDDAVDRLGREVGGAAGGQAAA